MYPQRCVWIVFEIVCRDMDTVLSDCALTVRSHTVLSHYALLLRFLAVLSHNPLSHHALSPGSLTVHSSLALELPHCPLVFVEPIRIQEMATSAWGLQALPMAPGCLIRVLKEHACMRWRESTGGDWGVRCPGSVRQRSVLPALMPRHIRNMVAAWISRCASDQGWTARHSAVLSATPAELERDLKVAGYGFAPPKTGDLGLHRDSKVTLLLSRLLLNVH